jgi:hypothetical protein
MAKPGEVIFERRSSLGLSEEEVAARLGVDWRVVDSLEARDEAEYHHGLSVVLCYLNLLELPPSAVFGYREETTFPVNAGEFRSLLMRELSERTMSFEELERCTHWSIAEIERDECAVLDIPLDGLQALCAALKVSWIDVLQGLWLTHLRNKILIPRPSSRRS